MSSIDSASPAASDEVRPVANGAESGELARKPPFKDPKPSVERISQLAQRVLVGDILLPKFQRDFIWPREKIIGLLDSIALNYPIGSILLWQSTQNLANERSIAGLSIAEPRPAYPVNYLLDGQQRLSTVCGALFWKPNNDPASLWNIVYDLRNEGFMHLATLEEPPITQIPLRLLSDPARYFQRTSTIENSDLRTRADRLFNRFQDYMIAAVTLGDMPIDDIAPIFERINSTATPLTIVDLMRAATWDPNFDLRDELDQILSDLKTRDFGEIDRKTILRVVSAASGTGFRSDDMERLRSLSVDELRNAVASAKEGAKRAVDFLTSHIKAPRAQAIPYVNQFAVLCEIFRHVPSPSGPQFTAIERWFWRTTLSGYFGGWNTGQMASDYAAVGKFAAGEAALEVRASLPRGDVWKITQFRANSAVSKMFALMASYAGPLDLITGQRIDPRRSLAWSNDKEFHHFFPRDYLKGVGVSSGDANAVGNIVMLTSASNIKITNKAPSIYLADIIARDGREVLESRLATLLVPPAALDAALVDDYKAFLELRSAHLQTGALALTGEAAETSETVDVVQVSRVREDEALTDDGDISDAELGQGS